MEEYKKKENKYSEEEEIKIGGRCILCGTKITDISYLCSDCSSLWTIDTVLGSIGAVEDYIQNEDIDGLLNSAEGIITSICGTLLTKNQTTAVIPTAAESLMNLGLNGYSELETILTKVARSQKARLLSALELANNAGVISDLDLSEGKIITEGGMVSKLANYVKVDSLKNISETFLMNFLSGYIYLKSGVIPIYDKYLRGEPIYAGNGITMIYSSTRRGEAPTLRVPKGVFAIFVAMLRLLEKADKDKELDESHIMWTLIIGGKTSASEYATKILPIIMAIDQEAAPFIGQKVWKDIDREKGRFVFNDILVERSPRIRERGEQLREERARERS